MYLLDALNLIGSNQFKDDFLKFFPHVNAEAFEAARERSHPELQIRIHQKSVLDAEAIEFWIVIDHKTYRLIYQEDPKSRWFFANRKPTWKLLTAGKSVVNGWEDNHP